MFDLAYFASFAASEDVADYLMMKSYIKREPATPKLFVTMKELVARRGRR